MFHFPRLPPPDLCVQSGVMAHHRHRVAPFGNPGISLLDGSSWLIAVIPRPSSARSAKASTVRRSHLTCATPRACIIDPSALGLSVVAHADPTGESRRAPRYSSAVVCMSSEPHTYLPRSTCCASNRQRESFPQPPQSNDASPQDDAAVDPAARSRGPPRGMLWTHLNHYVPCQGASQGRSPTHRSADSRTWGARANLTHAAEQMSTTR